MNKQSTAVSAGINAETLSMVRTRFILDWYTNYGSKYPFKLFEWQRQLLQNGLFDAYNQWIFATAQNLPAYQNWTANHSQEYNELIRLKYPRANTIVNPRLQINAPFCPAKEVIIFY